MKAKIAVFCVFALAIAGCSSGHRAPAYDMMGPLRVKLVNSCEYQGKGVEITDFKKYFTEDVVKSEYETRDQFLNRMKSKVPEYLTFKAKTGYSTYDAERGILKVVITRFAPPQGLQQADLSAQISKEMQNPLSSLSSVLRVPNGRSFPRIFLSEEIPYHTEMMGETAFGYRKEFTAARIDEYFASLGMLDSIKTTVNNINYYAEIPMSGAEAINAKDSLEIELTIRAVAPYLLSYKKDVISATISDPYALARYNHVFVGDYCTSAFIDTNSGKRYNAPLKVDLPYQ